jgi:hypothetical protein
VPADPGGAGRIHCRRVPGGAQRHPHQGRRRPGGAGPHPYRHVRQDRHPHRRRRPAHRRRDRAGRKRRRGAPPRRLPGAGLPSHRRRGDRRGRAGERARYRGAPGRTGRAPDWRAGSETARSASGPTNWSTARASPNNGRCTCSGAPPGARP